MSAPTPRGRGRPVIGPEVRGLRLGAVTLVEVQRLAAAAGVPRAELLRALIEEALCDEEIREVAATVCRVRAASRSARRPAR